jgi:hypothetical protein
MPSFMNHSCQRQTQVFDQPVRRMISLVPTPSALDRRPPSVFLRGLTVPGDRFKSAAGRGLPPRGGDAGATGVTICDWKIDRASYVATPVMSDGRDGPPLSCAGCLSNFCAR